MLFRDPARQAHFDEAGYLVADLLDASQIERLLALYDETVARAPQQGLFESSRHSSLELNFEIMHGIREVFAEPAGALFGDGTLFGGTFMVKVPGSSDRMPLHQDWNVVEEDRFQSAFVWCALVDIGPERGGLFVLPGSHELFHNIRSGSMPSVRIPPEGPLAELLVDVPLRAGQAIVYSDRLFHGSWANRTAEPRIVCTGRFNEAGSRLVYYHRTGDESALVLEASPRFYLKEIATLAKGGLVDGQPVLETIRYRHEPITEARLLARLASLGRLPRAASA